MPVIVTISTTGQSETLCRRKHSRKKKGNGIANWVSVVLLCWRSNTLYRISFRHAFPLCLLMLLLLVSRGYLVKPWTARTAPRFPVRVSFCSLNFLHRRSRRIVVFVFPEAHHLFCFLLLLLFLCSMFYFYVLLTHTHERSLLSFVTHTRWERTEELLLQASKTREKRVLSWKTMELWNDGDEEDVEQRREWETQKNTQSEDCVQKLVVTLFLLFEHVHAFSSQRIIYFTRFLRLLSFISSLPEVDYFSFNVAER